MKRLVKLCLVIMLLVFGVVNTYADEKSSDNTLKNVQINGENIVCTNYVCEKQIDDNSITNVTITYDVNDSKATVSDSELKKNISDGVNTFNVTVTAEDGKEQKYTFRITKIVMSTDSTLKKLSINGQTITLKNDTTRYETTVSYAANKLDVVVEANDSKAKIENANNNKLAFDFYDDTKEIKIKVTAEAGDVTTYTVKVTRRNEKEATLKTLTLSNVSFVFESGVFDYDVNVTKDVDKIDVTAVASDSSANITINNPKTLSIGKNEITIKVENDGNENIYTIKVNKLNESDNSLANLSSLKITDYEINFKEDKYEYNLEIGDINRLDIKATPKHNQSVVDITGNFDLVDGSIIKIRVDYDDETYNIYKINITKKVDIKKENNLLMIVSIISAGLLVIAIVVFIIIRKKKNGKNNKKIETNAEPVAPIAKKEIITLTSDDNDIEEII